VSKVKIFLSVFLILCLLASVAVLAGCGDDGDDDENGDNGNGNGDNGTAEQWAAYAFDNIASFTIEQTSDGEEVVIEGQYVRTETAAIKTERTDISTFETDTITTDLECYVVDHTITVDSTESEATLWIPTGGFDVSTTYFWIYPMAEYVDEYGNPGVWSYYVTEAMLDDEDYLYLPYTEGDAYGWEVWAYGLYGWAWTWFGAYAVDGEEYLEEFDFDLAGIHYSCDNTTVEVSGYELDAWTITMSVSGEGEYICTVSPDIGLPIYLKVGDSGDFYEYELTQLEMR
jgi:hypothetical protein